MKLALIVPGGFAPGGRENVIPALLALADELGVRHEVHVFAFGGPGGISRHSLVGAEIHQLGDPTRDDPPGPGHRGRRMVRLAGQLWQELGRAPRFDLFHAFWATEPGLFAGLLGRLRRIPVVVSVGGGETVSVPEVGYGGARSTLDRALTGWTLGRADELTVGSAFARALLPGAARGRARIVPLGIDCSRFDGPPVRPAGPPWRLLHVGSVNRIKDHRTLLGAFAEVVARLDDVTLDCVGEDTLGGEIQSHARALGLDARVRFRGFLPNEALAPLYRSAHLHLVSSLYESQSVALLEAAAAGLPTVGTAVGLLPTLAPGAACIVPPGDPRALADGISALLVDVARRESMGRAAQKFAQAHDVASTAGAFEEIYRRLVR